MNNEFEQAKTLIEKKLRELRAQVLNRKFDHRRPAEVEVNKFWFNGETVDRIMIVLRSSGCEHYATNQGCAMCSHYDGTTETPVSASDYFTQWQSVINGKAVKKSYSEFNINNYPVLCLYNLGSLLNTKEVPSQAVKAIFRSISKIPSIKKTIIESRAEYVTRDTLENIRSVHEGLVEVGMGLESINYQIRELCHHKNLPNLEVLLNAKDLLHEFNFRALAYVNQKPAFLTELESIDDSISTTVYAFENNFDAVSIEPTSLQTHSLTDYLHQQGLYRVPWLWSVIKAVEGISKKINNKSLDLRLGGYFDEEVLSGSQGVAPGMIRNELFPHITSGNCSNCNDRIVSAIKEFNRTYNLQTLLTQEPCNYCYPQWQADLRVIDKRPIPIRIIETLE